MVSSRIRRLPAVVLTTVGLLAAGHIGATLAYTGPDTPVKAALQPALDRYFLGPLDQGWNLFAPGPYSQDEYMLVRACLSEMDVCAGGDAAGAEFTEWRNVTAEELEAAEYNIFADRETRQSKVVHGRFWPVANDLPDAQRAMAEANHIDGEPVFGVDLSSPEASEVYSDSELGTLRTYERLEEVAVGLGTLVMRQEHGDAVTLVEVRMLRESVPGFSQRHDPPGEPAQHWTSIGWRPAMEFDEETLEAWS